MRIINLSKRILILNSAIKNKVNVTSYKNLHKDDKMTLGTFQKNIISLRWYYLVIGTLFFSHITFILFTFLLGIQENISLYELISARDSFVFSLILVPIVLFSLKILKSFTTLAFLSIITLTLRAIFIIYLVDSMDLTAKIGERFIYQSGEIDSLGWMRLILNPLLAAFLFSTYMTLMTILKTGNKNG